MKLNVQRIFLLVNLLLYVPVAVLLWAGLSRKDYSANQKENCYRIGVSYMTMNNEFYKIVNEEILNRAEMEGDQVILRDPALDAKRQVEQIEEMLAMDVDVLVVTPVDGKRLSEVLNRAKGQGVYIVVGDTNLEDERLADCTITSDNYSAGCLVGQYFLKENQLGENPFGEKQDVNLLVMTHDSAKSGQDRVRGFLDVVEKSDRVHVVQRINCDGQLEIAMPKIEEVIRKGTAFDTVFCLNDLAAVGVVAALDEHELLERVKVYGIDASPDAKALIKEGMMSASSAQFPSRIGQTAADVIYRLLRGEEVEKEIFLPVELVTRENVEEYSISRWQ